MQQELKKELGFLSALSMVMGTVIGAGVFFKAATVYAATGSASLGMFSWFLGGIITICAGLTGAELAAAIPKTGGMMAYIEHTYGKFPAFLLGWAQTFVYFPANIAALAIIFATQMTNLFGIDQKFLVIIAIIAATSIMLINFLGAKLSGLFQSATLICKLLPIFMIVVFGFLKQGDVPVQLFPIVAGQNQNFMNALGSGLLATMFAYDGWLHVGNIAGEMKNPKKHLPRAITLGLSLVMSIYLLINLAFLFSVPLPNIAGNPNAASDVAQVIFGSNGGKIVTIGILISVYGTINGYTMAGIRIPYAMAINNQLPFSKWLKKLSPKSKIPVNSGLLVLVMSIILITVGGFDTLTDILVFVIWIFYFLTFLAVFILRKREPELYRPYKVPLYPIIPGIALLGGGFILINTLFTQTWLAMVGIILTALGIPVYVYMKKKKFS